MPIYAYRCSDCGFEKDYLQRMSDPLLTDCPQCLKGTLAKQLTAAGFQLKGSGWYATDFKNGAKPAANNSGDKAESAEPAKSDTAKPDSGKAEPANGQSDKSESSKTATPKTASSDGGSAVGSDAKPAATTASH